MQQRSQLSQTAIPTCKAKRQYIITCKVSRYCILSLQSESGATLREHRNAGKTLYRTQHMAERWMRFVLLPIHRDLTSSAYIHRCVVQSQKAVSAYFTSTQILSKHETFTQFWFNVCPLSTTLTQHWTNLPCLRGCRVAGTLSPHALLRNVSSRQQFQIFTRVFADMFRLIVNWMSGNDNLPLIK